VTTAVFDTVAPSTGAQRIGSVLKLHLANLWTTIVLPWIILGIIFAANLALWWIIYLAAPGAKDRADVSQGLQYSGASFYILVYMMVVAVQAINITFPFALGFGVTRKDYYLGTSVLFMLLSIFYSVGLTILSVIEDATNGWGLGGHMFTAIYFGANWQERLFIFFVGLLFFFFLGASVATLYVRWRANGLIAFFVTLTVLAIGSIAWLTLGGSWDSFGAFFATSGLVGSVAWSLVITLVAGVTGYFVLRGATPRN
jgi:hypothetical protein